MLQVSCVPQHIFWRLVAQQLSTCAQHACLVWLTSHMEGCAEAQHH